MPFRDHFRPPISRRHSWEEVHGGWPMMIIQKFAPVLPVSPANKDRPVHRNNFVSECAALLKQEVCVVLVDIVTIRSNNLYLQLLDHFELIDSEMSENDEGVYAACCRTRRTETKTVFDFWRNRLALGKPLPTLPLWLTEKLSIPLDLEASYEETCRLLRIV